MRYLKVRIAEHNYIEKKIRARAPSPKEPRPRIWLEDSFHGKKYFQEKDRRGIFYSETKPSLNKQVHCFIAQPFPRGIT